MLSLDLTDFIEEEILVKNKYCIYSSIIRLTFDRTLIRCVPMQALNGGRALYDGRTIYAPIEANDRTQPTIYYAGQTGRINSRQTNESNVPRGVTEVVMNFETASWTTLEGINE